MHTFKAKPLSQQAIVITGATSGIGLATARLAARNGAAVFLVARSRGSLHALAHELAATGVRTGYAVADVGDEAEVTAASEAAIQRLGSYDTWVNCAGVSIYGPAWKVPLDEQLRLFSTNYWGTVVGSLIAVAHFRQRGGTLINVGSELSDVPLQLQSAYVASKHAVKGFTNSLRLDLQSEAAPVNVCLIKPAGTDTLFVEHARKHTSFNPKLPPPVYAPEVVARAILHAAEHGTRELFAGGASKGMSVLGQTLPRAYDLLLRLAGSALQRSPRSEPRGPDGLDAADDNPRTRSGRNGRVVEHSLYTFVTRKPTLAIGAAVLAAMVVSAIAFRHGKAPD
jgi:short-subunit dehydrogenase